MTTDRGSLADRPIEDRLEKLAYCLRLEGAIYGPERDMMVDAANLIRTLRASHAEISGLVTGIRVDLGGTPMPDVRVDL